MAAGPIYSFTQKTTTVAYPWPPTVAGIERIALSAQGDLQRVLSAFFARPITVAVVYSHTYWQPSPDAPSQLLTHPDQAALASASPGTPIIQRRQVHLLCSGKVVCTASSVIRITSPRAAQLFLVDKFAIGQMFRRMDKMPVFDLLAVGLGRCTYDEDLNTSATSTHPNKSKELWRKYKLCVPDFECNIIEVFPDRQMFTHGESWLDDHVTAGEHVANVFSSSKDKSLEMIVHSQWLAGLGQPKVLYGAGVLLMLYWFSLLTGDGHAY